MKNAGLFVGTEGYFGDPGVQRTSEVKLEMKSQVFQSAGTLPHDLNSLEPFIWHEVHRHVLYISRFGDIHIKYTVLLFN